MKLASTVILTLTLLLPGAALTSSRHAQQTAPSEIEAPLPDSNAIDNFDVLGATVGYIRAEAFLKFMSDADAGIKAPGMFEGTTEGWPGM